MVSIMLSMKCCTAGLFNSLLSSARAFSRRTGCPILATFRIDMIEFYTVVSLSRRSLGEGGDLRA